MELDEEFGWLTGIYLAEGNSTQNYLSISNTEQPILEKVRDFAGAYNLTSNEYDNTRGFSLGHDIRINSTLLSQFMKVTCGTGSYEKNVPQFAYLASESFIGSLLRGYFDGDGNVSLERKVIRASSKSKDLIDGISLLLSRLGILASKKKDKQGYALWISHRYANLFLEKIGSDIEEKRNDLKALSAIKSKADYNLVDVIPGIGGTLLDAARALKVPSRFVNNFTKRDRIGRSTLLKYLSLFESVAAEKGVSLPELDVLRRAAESDVIWDEITQIEEVEPTKYVYDFTVPGSETFATFDGLLTHNTMRTFHYAGVAEQVPLGLPRLIELVDARRAPKKPMMDIYLTHEYANSEKKAIELAKELEEVGLKKIGSIREDFSSKSVNIILDESLIKEKSLTVGEVVKKIRASTTGSVESDHSKVTIKHKVALRSIRRMTNKLRQLHIIGVKNIKRAVVIPGKEGRFIRTGGSNLLDVLAHKGVDTTRTYTNDVKEVEKVFGIEAARNAIVREIQEVMDSQNLRVDIRHIMLLADAMTMDGSIKSVGRHGLSGQKAGILARAAFEETIKHLIAAAIKADEDKLVGVTENIIIGQMIPVGTGTVKLVMKKM